MKNKIKYLIILAISFLLVLSAEMFTPREVNWSMSFSERSKIPYGNYVLYNLLPDLFPNKKTIIVHDSIYDTVKEKSFKNINYIFINTTFNPDKFDTDQLINFVREGNTVFIAAFKFYGEFAKRFKIKTGQYSFTEKSAQIKLINWRFGKKYYPIKSECFYFSSFKKKRASVLGLYKEGYANYIKLKKGKGAFYISTVPLAFTNYNVLKEKNTHYAFRALSYLPVTTTFWDEHYKVGAVKVSSPLKYILSKGPLRWAWYLSLIGLILFIFFKSRRRQRIIPVIMPLKNVTLKFIETVGKLYYQQGDHKNIAEKKILYFFDYIRTKFYIEDYSNLEDPDEKLSQKTGVSKEDVRLLFDSIDTVKRKKKLREHELITLNLRIENFYRESGYYEDR